MLTQRKAQYNMIDVSGKVISQREKWRQAKGW